MNEDLLGALIGALFIGGTGLGLIWIGRTMIAGRIDPAMGHLNADNTTPESWRATRLATGKAFLWCGWLWIVTAIAVVLFIPAGVGLLVVVSIWFVVQIVRASKLLTPMPG